MPESPWSGTLRLKSPDGSVTACIDRAEEIGMGAPTLGTLSLSNGMTLECCNPSAVWSEDSRYLAIPQWTKGREQRLVVIDVREGKIYPSTDVFRVLELHDFRAGVISGIDSPAYRPAPISVRMSVLLAGHNVQR